jgi:predicted transcriptional regulator
VKLYEYVAILGTLANHGPINPAQMVSLVSIDHDKLKLALSFLQNQGFLLSETPDGKILPSYSITKRGLRILDFFRYQK